MHVETNIEGALSLGWPIIDVRSPGEFDQGHIPGAVNIPLFTNDERAHVGTVYKQQSKQAAFDLGYKYVTPKLADFITQSFQLAPTGEVVVHCWRGGMRSRSFAQHLSDNGFTHVKVIVGGYKAYRNLVLNTLSKPVKLNVLGGFTGSGKTNILHELKQRGHQVIDLEGLANHKGSAFGGIGQGEQPTVEQFANNLHQQWQKLNVNEPIWLEDESHSIGQVQIPMELFKQIRSAKLLFVDILKEERAKHLVNEYALCDNQKLSNSILRISKRLGGQNVNAALELLENENYYEVALIVLHYYDKAYLKGMNNRTGSEVLNITLATINHKQNAIELENICKLQ